MRILVTGITGFAGSHLADALRARGGDELFGVSRRREWPADCKHLEAAVDLRSCDLCDPAQIEALLRDIRPERIYHLAGYAKPGQSFSEVEAAWASNLTATRSLYEAIVHANGKPRILYVGSGLVYGDPDVPEMAYDENAPLRPSSPYAASKAAADLASYQYTRYPGLDIIRVRPFNHIGPRQSSQYAVAHFAEQIAEIERGQRPPVLETGNLSPLRDLTDVRDMVRAYVLLMDKGRSGEVYNAASGQTHSMQEILDHLISIAHVQVEVKQQANLVRAKETATIRGDASKLKRETGWEPKYSLHQTLSETLAYWRKKT